MMSQVKGFPKIDSRVVTNFNYTFAGVRWPDGHRIFSSRSLLRFIKVACQAGSLFLSLFRYLYIPFFASLNQIKPLFSSLTRAFSAKASRKSSASAKAESYLIDVQTVWLVFINLKLSFPNCFDWFPLRNDRSF